MESSSTPDPQNLGVRIPAPLGFPLGILANVARDGQSIPGPLHSLRSRVGHDNTLLHRWTGALPNAIGEKPKR